MCRERLEKDRNNAVKKGEPSSSESCHRGSPHSPIDTQSPWSSKKKRTDRDRRQSTRGSSSSYASFVEEIDQEEKEEDETIKAKTQSKKRRFKSTDEDDAMVKPKKRRINKEIINFKAAGLDPAPGLPSEFKDFIVRKEGIDEKLVIMKQVFITELSTHHGRFSIPVNQIRDLDSLTETEKEALNRGGSMKLAVIDPWLDKVPMTLTQWNMKKSSSYVLTTGWNQLLVKNEKKKLDNKRQDCEETKQENPLVAIEANDVVQVWSYRCSGQLCLALVKVKLPGRDQNNIASISGSCNAVDDPQPPQQH